jgi:hypothetical protein
MLYSMDDSIDKEENIIMFNCLTDDFFYLKVESDIVAFSFWYWPSDQRGRRSPNSWIRILKYDTFNSWHFLFKNSKWRYRLDSVFKGYIGKRIVLGNVSDVEALPTSLIGLWKSEPRTTSLSSVLTFDLLDE